MKYVQIQQLVDKYHTDRLSCFEQDYYNEDIIKVVVNVLDDGWRDPDSGFDFKFVHMDENIYEIDLINNKVSKDTSYFMKDGNPCGLRHTVYFYTKSSDKDAAGEVAEYFGYDYDEAIKLCNKILEANKDSNYDYGISEEFINTMKVVNNHEFRYDLHKLIGGMPYNPHRAYSMIYENKFKFLSDFDNYNKTLEEFRSEIPKIKKFFEDHGIRLIGFQYGHYSNGNICPELCFNDPGDNHYDDFEYV